MRSIGRIWKSLERRLEIARLVEDGRLRYGNDPRFCINGVERGLLPQARNAVDDRALLERICEAWTKCVEGDRGTNNAFEAHDWWRGVREKNLEPVIRALSSRNYDALRMMYRNFFRDACGAGVCGLPGGKITHLSSLGRKAKQLQLIDALHRIDLWREKTAARFTLADLQAPPIGNPFGTFVDEILVRTGCEDQHYSAHQIIDLIDLTDAPVVAEIGGGFGGMAYYLLRDHSSVTYVDFDLPETIALASYYLLSAFPDVHATLYGEAELDANTLQRSRIILMPSFAMPNMPARSADLTFNARLFFDLSPQSLHHYLAETARITRGYVVHMNQEATSLRAHEWLTANAPEFEFMTRHRSTWNDARTLHPNEVENLYRRRSLR